MLCCKLSIVPSLVEAVILWTDLHLLAINIYQYCNQFKVVLLKLGHPQSIVIASLVSKCQLSIVWLWLWVRCWVCPLFVRLPVCPLAFSQFTFHLCPVGCKSRWKCSSVSISELFPVWFMSDCVVPDFISQPLTLVRLPGAFRTYSIWGSGIRGWHPSAAIGSGTQD